MKTLIILFLIIISFLICFTQQTHTRDTLGYAVSYQWRVIDLLNYNTKPVQFINDNDTTGRFLRVAFIYSDTLTSSIYYPRYIFPLEVLNATINYRFVFIKSNYDSIPYRVGW